MSRKIDIEADDLHHLIGAILHPSPERTKCLVSKQNIPASMGDESFLRLDFGEDLDSPGYYMVTLSEHGIEVTYMAHECGDGQVCLSYKFKRPTKPKSKSKKARS